MSGAKSTTLMMFGMLLSACTSPASAPDCAVLTGVSEEELNAVTLAETIGKYAQVSVTFSMTCVRFQQSDEFITVVFDEINPRRPANTTLWVFAARYHRARAEIIDYTVDYQPGVEMQPTGASPWIAVDTLPRPAERQHGPSADEAR